MINPVIIKIAVWALVIKEIWLLMQIPSVANAVVSFVTVGEIPGTGDTLSLTQMVLLLTGVFIIAAALIFRRELVSVSRMLFKRKKPQATTPMPIAPIPPVTFAVPVIRQEPKAPMANRLPVLVAGRNTMLRIASLMKRRIISRILFAAGRMKVLSVRVKGYLLRYGVVLVSIALLLARITADLSVHVWKWLRPKLERFDRYLEKRVHQNQYGSAAISIFDEIIVTVKQRWPENKAKGTALKLQRK